MMGTDRSLPFFSNASGMDEHHWGVFRIHVFAGRRKEKVHSSVGRELRIVVERSWVAVEVFARPKLEWVDEDAHYHGISHTLRFVHQCEMPFMKCSHRRDESDALSFCAQIGNDVTHFVDRSDKLH